VSSAGDKKSQPRQTPRDELSTKWGDVKYWDESSRGHFIMETYYQRIEIQRREMGSRLVASND
jgi:hypothetical protein